MGWYGIERACAMSPYFYVGQRLTDYSGFDFEVHAVKEGGFGEVALGIDQTDGQWQAVKILKANPLAAGATTEAQREQQQRLAASFLREALTWKGLWPHPNLLTAQFVAQINGQPMLVLDYAEQGSLRDRFETLRRRGAWLRLASALDLAQMIAAGLLALHTPAPDLLRDFPIVHRGLKPENILLDQNEDMMITDFGLAKALTDALAPSGLAMSALAGSPETTDASLLEPPAAASQWWLANAPMSIVRGRARRSVPQPIWPPSSGKTPPLHKSLPMPMPLASYSPNCSPDAIRCCPCTVHRHSPSGGKHMKRLNRLLCASLAQMCSPPNFPQREPLKRWSAWDDCCDVCWQSRRKRGQRWMKPSTSSEMQLSRSGVNRTPRLKTLIHAPRRMN